MARSVAQNEASGTVERDTDLVPQRIMLTGAETIAELRALGLPESTAHAARKRGDYCPNYKKRAYPQLEGPGGFADLYDPEGFVTNQLATALRRMQYHLDVETFRDWKQELLLECWRRRHAEGITRFPPYYMAVIHSLVQQWIRRRVKEEATTLFLEESPLCQRA